ncbi:hypothetical protein L1049_007331 [Liquidambar formosana]|uniref:Uncharacterized protein n=1 Tax=Liquidambar formosana TaxID=63359 RepID=A0AAP0RH87_LIQFO
MSQALLRDHVATRRLQEVEQQPNRWDGYVDWRNRPALRGRHGGMLAASFVLVVEVLENLAFLANASNLVLYLSEYMHFSLSKSANSVTDFMGTAFLLALLGGFLSDAFFTTYHIYLISAGLVILTVQAHSHSLKPPACDPTNPNIPCQEVSGDKAAMLFIGLYLVALGIGGIKGSLSTHGAEQFDQTTPQGRKQRSTFFNYFVFCLSCGGLIAVTFVVWIEDNKGWEWGFGISTLTIFLSIPIFLAGSGLYRNKIPCGSPLTTILKVLVAATLDTCITRSSSNAVASMAASPSHASLTSNGTEEHAKAMDPIQTPTKSLKFLNRAVQNKPVHTSTRMHSSASRRVFIMILAPFYDHFIIPFARRVTKTEMGITHLQRIGIGLVLSIIAMAVAALVEIKRKRVASNSGLLDSENPLPITFFWIAFQYLFLGSADLFTLAGLLEFFFTEAPTSMRSLATALSWASLGIGYYLSTVIVSIVNSVTGNSKHKPWLSGANLNHYHLERFYWLMCVLSGLNFLHYLFWACRYKYRSARANS